MSTHGDHLHLLLSLQDRVLETPPSSPSPGYLSDDGSARQRGQADMSVFRTAVEDCLDYEPETSKKPLKSGHAKSSSDIEVEKFSGLRIRNQLVSRTDLSDRFADIRFVRLTTIKNLLSGEILSGCWATVGVLYEKGGMKTSSTGKPYSIWQIGCLDEKPVSLFLFGNAYQKNCKEEVGTIFALFNCSVRNKSKEGFTLTVFSAPQVLKMGTSADFGTCKSCTQVINKRRGIHCKYHTKNAAQKYSTKRVEFMGGNLRTAFSFKDRMQSEGIYMVENKTNVAKAGQPKKVLSVEGLRKALSNAGKVTTNAYSQGIRFLSEVAGKPSSSLNHPIKSSDKRKSSDVESNLPEVKTSQQNAKRIKIEKGQQPSAAKTKQGTEKMVELELVSSDDEF
ncbi:protein MCM10 homolog [Cynara cardunculus var. scolymus]|uniref:Zinc finger, Mcm10/DnaG-type n=1 Tax=Cynara cardunculus var. scolymus TaxID=59895 RepID=A0A103XTE7_CYNCS|nr:protein MCM10 homolog [Cynara cardunculus var. scolymus]KVH96525.1 Zinc finger, Mcm10/DnaG-type [Cynara cardunculus var. scolymus]